MKKPKAEATTTPTSATPKPEHTLQKLTHQSNWKRHRATFTRRALHEWLKHRNLEGSPANPPRPEPHLGPPPVGPQELGAAHPHKLRHSYASALAEAGRPMVEVGESLGHDSIATTQVYVHTSRRRLEGTTQASGLRVRGGSRGPAVRFACPCHHGRRMRSIHATRRDTGCTCRTRSARASWPIRCRATKPWEGTSGVVGRKPGILGSVNPTPTVARVRPRQRRFLAGVDDDRRHGFRTHASRPIDPAPKAPTNFLFIASVIASHGRASSAPWSTGHLLSSTGGTTSLHWIRHGKGCVLLRPSDVGGYQSTRQYIGFTIEGSMIMAISAV